MNHMRSAKHQPPGFTTWIAGLERRQIAFAFSSAGAGKQEVE
jgi:hypothetical protein